MYSAGIVPVKKPLINIGAWRAASMPAKQELSTTMLIIERERVSVGYYAAVNQILLINVFRQYSSRKETVNQHWCLTSCEHACEAGA